MRQSTRERCFVSHFASGLCFVLAACQNTETEAGQLRVGDFDPKAPVGWPLAIGDRDAEITDMVEFVDQFDSWKGNCCINWIDGVPYTAKWRLENNNMIFGWKIYEGHVRAEPTDRWLRRNDPVEKH